MIRNYRDTNNHRLDKIPVLVHGKCASLKSVVARFLNIQVSPVHNQAYLIILVSEELLGNGGGMLFDDCVPIDVLQTEVHRDKVLQERLTDLVNNSRN